MPWTSHQAQNQRHSDGGLPIIPGQKQLSDRSTEENRPGRPHPTPVLNNSPLHHVTTARTRRTLPLSSCAREERGAPAIRRDRVPVLLRSLHAAVRFLPRRIQKHEKSKPGSSIAAPRSRRVHLRINGERARRPVRKKSPEANLPVVVHEQMQCNATNGELGTGMNLR